MIQAETTMIHLFDRERRPDEDQYLRQQQGYVKLSLWNLMITVYPDVWKRTVPSAAAVVNTRMKKISDF
jgi:hypothetical protein